MHMISSKNGVLRHTQQRPVHSRSCAVFSSRLPRLGRKAAQRIGRQEQAPGKLGKWDVRSSHVCRATVDDPDIQELVKKLKAMTPAPPEDRPQLDAAVAIIDEVNSRDPSKVPVDGVPTPYRLAYARWLTEWILRIDPNACDELLLIARGRNIEGWRLSEIRRDDYAPNTPGQRQWEMDRKMWQCNRLLQVLKEVDYSDNVISMVQDVMLQKNVPDPRDLRQYDLLGAFGMINYRTLQAACIMQTMADAEALLFLDKNFEEMFNRMPADEVASRLKKELSRMSQQGVITALKQYYNPVQQKILRMALPVPFKFNDIMMNVEGVAASSHPGDWRYLNFDYE